MTLRAVHDPVAIENPFVTCLHWQTFLLPVVLAADRPQPIVNSELKGNCHVH